MELQKVTPLSQIPVKTVLLIQNDSREASKISALFNDQGSYSFTLTQVGCMSAAETFLGNHSVHAVLLDLTLPDAQALDAVLRTRAAAPRSSIVLLAEPAQETMAILAMQAGVQDYLLKGQIESRELLRALRNSVARKIIEDSWFHEKDRAQVTLDCIGDAVICTDIEGNVSFMNPVAERMTGWALMEAAGRPLAEALHIMDASTGQVAPIPIMLAAGQARNTHLPPNCVLTRRDGHEVFIEDSVAPIHDREGHPAGSVLVFRDVTASRALSARIAHLAEHDSLTGLPNRLLLNDRLGQAIARASRSKSLIVILFLDLDGFKHINDSLGHPAGDRLLQSVSNRLLACVRTPDTVSRQGGDEFIVLLPDVVHEEDAALAAARILKAVAEPHTIDHNELHVTTSIGVSVYPVDGLDAESLMKNADTAMYQAKQTGRATYRFFKPEMNVRAVERQSIEESLRRALERHQFSLHYQPKINLRSGAITGAEALLRLNHPTRGMIPPMKFIPVAEESGLILPIGAWVLHEACRQVKVWKDAGLPAISMAVNVSAVQFRNETFLGDLTATLVETGMALESLELEVTESVLMERAELIAPILQTLRQKGVRVSVDDFGTGYSSLSYLRKLPLDALKIDQSFVRQISTPPVDTAIVSAIISMGKSLKLRVIAEGVENAEELAFLKAHDCDEAQGFYFSRPVPAAEFAKLLINAPARIPDA